MLFLQESMVNSYAACVAWQFNVFKQFERDRTKRAPKAVSLPVSSRLWRSLSRLRRFLQTLSNCLTHSTTNYA